MGQLGPFDHENSLGPSIADGMAIRFQLAFLHVHATSYGCTVRSPSGLTTFSRTKDIGVVGMGLPARTDGGAGGSSSGGIKVVCTSMMAEVSVDGGASWHWVSTQVCQMS